MPKKDSIDPEQYGVSFSIKQCRNFKLNPDEALGWLVNEAGFRRFRLMSYWNEHEKTPGVLDFSTLDRQIEQIEQADGVITLCLGVRQPRWPENHWPQWAWELPATERETALLEYVQAVVNRYKQRACVISYQLENEALLKNFGERPDVNRKRLRREYALVKRSDPKKPVVMTTSTSWGIPLRRPIPDIIGFSFYHTLYRADLLRYTTAFHPVWLHRLRKAVIQILHRKPVFIHEVQLEPWGPTAIWKMTNDEQAKSMGSTHIAENIKLVSQIKAAPVDLWGGEWWYWRLQQNDSSIWQAVQQALQG